MTPLLLALMVASPASAGQPWHTTRNHTDLWSPIDEHATAAVVARELALTPRTLRSVLARGRQAAMWDQQPGHAELEAFDPEDDRPVYAELYTLRALGRVDGEPGFAVEYRADGRWIEAHEAARPPVYALAGGDNVVVWDGESLHITRVWDRSDEHADHTPIRLDRFLSGERYWVGLVEERLVAPGSMLQMGIFDVPSGGPVPKVYVLPVDEAGELVEGEPGLVISLDGDDEEHENVLRAAWVRTDIDPAPWPDDVDTRDNPHRKHSAVAQVPPIQAFSLEHLYVDGVLEGGVDVDILTEEIRPLVGGEIGVGGRYWTTQLLTRPQLIGAAAWMHANRRRPWGAGLGLVLGGWAGKARPALGARLAFPIDVFSKVELEGLVSVDRAGAGVRYMIIDWNVERKHYVSGGLVGRISTGDAFSGDRIWLGLAFSYSYRHTWVSVD